MLCVSHKLVPPCKTKTILNQYKSPSLLLVSDPIKAYSFRVSTALLGPILFAANAVFGVPMPPVHLSPLILARASWLAVSSSPVWPPCVHSWVMVQIPFTVQTTGKLVFERSEVLSLRGNVEPLLSKQHFLPPSFDHICHWWLICLVSVIVL